MRVPRVTLLLAAALLVAAELVSLSLLLRGIGEHQTFRTKTALDRAHVLMPRIGEWARSPAVGAPETVVASWIEPFDELAAAEANALSLDEDDRRRLGAGELVVVSRITDPVVSVIGSVRTDRKQVLFRLTDTSSDLSRLFTDQTLIAQHALILFAAFSGFVLAALNREASEAGGATPALRAYEEAMSRLRLRDDARLAAFDREKLQMTEVLRDREAMARAGELTAGIVHEVRNSMGVISAQAKFAEKSEDERVRGVAASIAEEIHTLQSVMSRFLDFIRTEKVQNAGFDLKRLVARVVARERPNHPARIDLEGVETLVEGDEDLLERAIENVVRNACQASGEGGRVVVKFGADATQAFVIVEDTGPGIGDTRKALRPFESERAGGLGLGLPLVLKILTLHHGSLDLGQGPGGRGTQAVCRWPKTVHPATTGNSAEPRVQA